MLSRASHAWRVAVPAFTQSFVEILRLRRANQMWLFTEAVGQ